MHNTTTKKLAYVIYYQMDEESSVDVSWEPSLHREVMMDGVWHGCHHDEGCFLDSGGYIDVRMQRNSWVAT
ncbi:unnamed protein product [Rotaria sp. Silwood1]|nr:unnamed protein product [Rotaria sp. Silwood1]CAF1659221.1 unnamed protein product [Rotaria sp. Silwood1]CAF5062540.1 unnamed protein product [Rotaria sp. Silwood1]